MIVFCAQQVAPVDGRSVCCRLEEACGQVEVFLRARSSFTRYLEREWQQPQQQQLQLF